MGVFLQLTVTVYHIRFPFARGNQKNLPGKLGAFVENSLPGANRRAIIGMLPTHTCSGKVVKYMELLLQLIMSIVANVMSHIIVRKWFDGHGMGQ